MIFDPITNHITKTELVYKTLFDAIITGKLRPGTRLIVKDIVRELAVSDSPVREALKKLEATGLIIIKPYAGAEVVTPSAEWIEEVFVMRAALEGIASGTSVPHLSDADVQNIIDLNEKMQQYATNGQYPLYAQIDREFHRLIYMKTPYRGLIAHIEELWTKSEYGRAIFGLVPEWIIASCKEHDELVIAVKDRDAERIERIVRHQKLRVGKEISGLIRRNKNSI